MGAIIKPFMPKPRPAPTPVPEVRDVKSASSDPGAVNFNPSLTPSVSPDTDVVNEGVNKIIKKGKASTIVTGVMGDISKPNVFKPLLGGGS
jgi:hypothetical protein|tara:strand:- start:685 stop:957 length:273 start_codon:yes stop_codon:yes gene_type:complete